MFAKCLSSNSWYAVVAIAMTQSVPGVADDFHYFGGAIDYWHEARTEGKATQAKPSQPVKGSESGDPASAHDEATGGSRPNGKFPWQQYLDPKNKEFFKEGDYTPPEPFMEIVRNPSDANLKLWFEYIGKKNELSGRLQARMQEYVAKNSISLPAEEKERVSARISAFPKAAPNAKRYRFRLYFDSHCPHCKRMLGTMAELQSRGYFVEARQVDRDTRELSGLPIPVEQAAPSELRDKEIQSVPVLLVGDLSKKVAYRINGYQTMAQVLSALPKEDGQ